MKLVSMVLMFKMLTVYFLYMPFV